MQLTTREKSLTVVRSSAEIADQGSAELLRAFAMLSRRGTGLGSWAAPFRHDPIAFLLDSVSDATNLWGPAGELLYRNRAAAELDIGYPSEAPTGSFFAMGRRLERRTLSYRCDDRELLLEIIHVLP